MRIIDADALIPAIKKGFYMPTMASSIDRDYAIAIINEAPTIQPKRGEWVRAINDYDHAYHNYCSLCREWNGMDVEGWNWTPNFCPNCGADMRKGEDNETNY